LPRGINALSGRLRARAALRTRYRMRDSHRGRFRAYLPQLKKGSQKTAVSGKVNGEKGVAAAGVAASKA